jgi:hypothetical protein
MPANKCYKCRTSRPASPTLLDDQYGQVSGKPRVAVSVDLSRVQELAARDPVESQKGSGVFEAFTAQDDLPIESARTAEAARSAPPPMREPVKRGISELGGQDWRLGLPPLPAPRPPGPPMVTPPGPPMAAPPGSPQAGPPPPGPPAPPASAPPQRVPLPPGMMRPPVPPPAVPPPAGPPLMRPPLPPGMPPYAGAPGAPASPPRGGSPGMAPMPPMPSAPLPAGPPSRLVRSRGPRQHP